MDNWKRILLKAAGIGAGFSITAAIILGICVWWSSRPEKQKPLDPHAITATFSGMTMQVRDESMHLTVIYGLHNTTAKDFSLPSIGELMIVNPENKGLDGIDGVTWDTTTRIPAGQTANIKFDIPYPLGSYNTTAAKLTDEKAMVQFIKNRLKEIDGFRFFDFTDRYEINCPKWPTTPDTP